MEDGPCRDHKGQSYLTPQILDPSMKDWYQYQTLLTLYLPHDENMVMHILRACASIFFAQSYQKYISQ